MTSLTVRNIPDEILDKIKLLSEIERRSLNSEILFILEKGLKSQEKVKRKRINKETRLSILNDVFGSWVEDKPAKKITNEIFSTRTKGREVNL